jgi:hypothetical protein
MQIDKLVKYKPASAARLTLIVFAILGAESCWWNNSPPDRPKGVTSDAVYLWAPHVGFPRSPKGVWLSCRVVTLAPIVRCRLIESSGSLSYEGDFELKDQLSSISPGEVIIDPEKTRKDWLNVRGIPVPLIYLKNGMVLIPNDAREQGLRLLEQLESVAQ